MADDLRVYGFSLQVENSDGKQKIVEFRKAVSNLDDSVEMLNSTLADNITVTARTAQNEKEASQQAKLLLTQQERQYAKTKQVITQYKLLNQTIETYGNDLETVNAITRLGSNATDAQRQEVAALVAQYQLLRKAGDTAGSGFRGLRSAAQNLGWQLQDVAVQAQMGTSNLVIMSQQLPQMLSSFGAWGALAGAGVAVVGAALPSIIKYLDDTTTSTKELEEAQSRVNAVLNQSGFTVKGVSEDLKELYDVNKQLAELKLISAYNDAQIAVNSYGKEIETTLGSVIGKVDEWQKMVESTPEALRNMSSGSGILANFGADANKSLNKVTETLGINRNQLISLSDAYQNYLSTGSTKQLATEMLQLSKSTTTLDADFKSIIDKFVESASKGELANLQLKELKELMSGTKTVNDSFNDTLENTVDKYIKLRAQLGMTDEQKAVSNYLSSEGVKATEKEREATIDMITAYYLEKQALENREAAKKKADEATKQRLKNLTEEYLKVQESLTGSNDPGATNAIDQENSLHAKNLAALENAKKAELDVTKNYDALIEAEGKRHNLAMTEAYVATMQGNIALVSQAQSLMSTIADEFATGTQDVKDATEDMTSFQKAMFVVQRSISAATAFVNGVELGSALAKMFPLAAPAMIASGTALGAASAGAIMGTTFAGAFDEGGKIPTGQTGIVSEYGDELVNGVLVKGPADVTSREDTARIMSDNGSNALSELMSEYDKLIETVSSKEAVVNSNKYEEITNVTNTYPDNGSNALSEYGNSLVNNVTLKGAANVINNERTDTPSSNNDSNGVTVYIDIDSTAAPGVQYSQSTDSDGRIKLIATQVFNDNIDEGVAGVLSSKNSKADKAIRSNYNSRRVY